MSEFVTKQIDVHIKTCTGCAADIAAEATTCPYCLADQRSWYGRHKKLIATTFLLCMPLLGVAGALYLHALLNTTPPHCENTVNCIDISAPDGIGPVIGGTVTSSPAGINCPPTCSATFNRRTWVTLTATPSRGWAFADWISEANTGDLTDRTDCYGRTDPCTMWMDDDAYFWSAGFQRK